VIAGELGPIPNRNRPSATSCIVSAVWASIDGVRPYGEITSLEIPSSSVRSAASVSGGTMFQPVVSPTVIRSKPSSSA